MSEVTYFVDSDPPDIPEDYEFFAFGDRFLTRRVKRLCQEHSVTYYKQVRKWRNKTNAVGYHAPTKLIELAKHMRDATAHKRASNSAERLLTKPAVIDAVKRFVSSIGTARAMEILGDAQSDEIFQVLKACNGSRATAQVIVKLIERAQLGS